MVSGEIFPQSSFPRLFVNRLPPHQVVVPGPVVVIRRGWVFFTPIAGQNLIVNGRTRRAVP